MRPFRNQALFCGGAFRLFSFSGGKEHTVKIRYNDPYGSPFELIIPDGEPEALKEIIKYLNESARHIRNAECRETYHTLYHLEALDYEGNSIAYLDTPEHIVIRKEETEHIRNTLTLLTETQQRRLSCSGSMRTTSTEKYPTTVFPECPLPTKPSRNNWKQESQNWRRPLRRLGNNA